MENPPPPLLYETGTFLPKSNHAYQEGRIVQAIAAADRCFRSDARYYGKQAVNIAGGYLA